MEATCNDPLYDGVFDVYFSSSDRCPVFEAQAHHMNPNGMVHLQSFALLVIFSIRLYSQMLHFRMY